MNNVAGDEWIRPKFSMATPRGSSRRPDDPHHDERISAFLRLHAICIISSTGEAAPQMPVGTFCKRLSYAVLAEGR